jgi:hypothetical protein
MTQDEIILAIQALVNTLPPPLRKKYQPRTYHKQANIGQHVYAILKTGHQYTNKDLCEIISREKGYEVASGAVLYHLNKGIATDRIYKVPGWPSRYQLTKQINMHLSKSEMPTLIRKFVHADHTTNQFVHAFVDECNKVSWLDELDRPLPTNIRISPVKRP